MRSISSPVPTGTVDLVTTTAVSDKQRRNLAHGFVDEPQIGMAVAAARRRANRDEYRLGVGDRRQVHCEFQPALANIVGDKIGQSRLENRNLAALERGDPARILVDANHMMAEVGQASARYETDIASADHGHAHEGLRFKFTAIRSRTARFPTHRM